MIKREPPLWQKQEGIKYKFVSSESKSISETPFLIYWGHHLFNVTCCKLLLSYKSPLCQSNRATITCQDKIIKMAAPL